MSRILLKQKILLTWVLLTWSWQLNSHYIRLSLFHLLISEQHRQDKQLFFFHKQSSSMNLLQSQGSSFVFVQYFSSWTSLSSSCKCLRLSLEVAETFDFSFSSAAKYLEWACLHLTTNPFVTNVKLMWLDFLC